jgi:hypothetical protein
MNWKTSLDRFLTTPPDDGYEDWAEELVGNHISDQFFDNNEWWLKESDGQCKRWMNDLFYKKGKSPKEAALILERAFKIAMCRSIPILKMHYKSKSGVIKKAVLVGNKWYAPKNDL